MHDTHIHASDHLCQIWKESIQNCVCCRADVTRLIYLSSFIAKSWAQGAQGAPGAHILLPVTVVPVSLKKQVSCESSGKNVK